VAAWHALKRFTPVGEKIFFIGIGTKLGNFDMGVEYAASF